MWKMILPNRVCAPVWVFVYSKMIFNLRYGYADKFWAFLIKCVHIGQICRTSTKCIEEFVMKNTGNLNDAHACCAMCTHKWERETVKKRCTWKYSRKLNGGWKNNNWIAFCVVCAMRDIACWGIADQWLVWWVQMYVFISLGLNVCVCVTPNYHHRRRHHRTRSSGN